jgi:tetratricopeptide (TPR) repeat protein
MKKATSDKANRKHTIITALGTIALAFLMLVSIAGAAQSTNVWFHKGNELMSSEKYNEAIKAYNKAIEINPRDSDAWYNEGLALDHLNRSDEAITGHEITY